MFNTVCVCYSESNEVNTTFRNTIIRLDLFVAMLFSQ